MLIRVKHVIVGLNVGGAESMLKRLIESSEDSKSYLHSVVSLTTLGIIGQQLKEHGVDVKSLGMRSLIDIPRVLWCLVRLIRSDQADIVQTWMYHADLLGGLAARIAGSCSIVWNLRSTAIPQGVLSITYWLVRLCAICSYCIPDRIICCANSAKAAHINLRYASSKIAVIPNGYDFSTLEFDSNSMKRARIELGFNDCDIVIGAVGRFDPLKDFHNFVVSASLVAAQYEHIKFLMVGRGNEWSNATLRGWIEEAGLKERIKLVGQRTDVFFLLSAMDIFCLSSVKEAFPNVVVEAMAMGLPCVVTRAGDAAGILGDDCYVVPVQDSISLAGALLRMCDLDPVDRKLLGERNAKKVREEYGIAKIRRKYEEIYDEALGK
jgi:glycosyltransferase involved in cell wall biosynthesis